MAMAAPVVVKLGGEVIEGIERISAIAAALSRLAARSPLVVVHGGGREIDTELGRHGIATRAVDGLRITDAATLDVVVAVLAGTLNTRLVAALAAAGTRAVGLTGADAAVVRVEPAPPHRSTDGRRVDLGLVGRPVDHGRPALVDDLLARGYVPVIASLGLAADGRLFNVNADTMASSLAARLGAARLVIAGGTAGVLDRTGRVIPELGEAAIADLVERGEASAGMVAKLAACREALDAGVPEILIVDGLSAAALETTVGTRIVRTASAGARLE